MFAAILMTLLGLAMALWPRVVWAVSASLSMRTPQRVEPSVRQCTYWRMSGTLFAGLGIAMGVGLATFDDPGVKGKILAGIAWTGAAIIVGLLVYAFRLDEDEASLPPDEPSGFAYGFWTLLFSGCAVVALLMGGAAWATPSTSEREAAWAQAGVDKWGDVLATQTRQVAEIQEGVATDPVGEFVVIDHEAREPAQLWAAAEAMGEDEVARLEAGDLLLISDAAFHCDTDGAVVREEADGAAPGVVEVAIQSSAAGGLRQCLGEWESSLVASGVVVDLAAPLGQRSVVSFEGAGGCDVERDGVVPRLHAMEEVEIDHCGPWRNAGLAWGGGPFDEFEDFEIEP